jgi:hypothetical protein
VTSPGEVATAGGLLVALALLQIAQQVIGVFDPRASIQATLIVAGRGLFVGDHIDGRCLEAGP